MRRNGVTVVVAVVMAGVVSTGIAACGGNDDTVAAPAAGSASPPAVSVAATAATQPAVSDAATATTQPAAVDGLPAAEPSVYVGRNRVVHLAVEPDGSTPVLDVWARRSFEFAPILLAEGLQYGDVSEWYGRPDHMRVVVVPSGAGPDAESFAELFSAADGEQYTNLVMWDRDLDAAAGFLLEDVAPGRPAEFPAAEPGRALVQLYAYQLRLNPLSEGDGFEQTIAELPTSFNVGIEGVEGCAPQPRVASPAVLGGTQRVAFDLTPGTTSFTFHGWGSSNQGCLDPTMFGPIDVAVEADQRAWVLLHTADGESIESLVVPLD